MATEYEPNILDILSGSAPDAREYASAMSGHLRKKQLLAELMATAPQFKDAAHTMAADVGGQQKLMENAGMGRLHYGEEAQALKRSLAGQQQEAGLLRQALANQGSLAVAKERGDSALEVQKLKNLLAQAATGKGQIVLGPDGNFVIVNKTTGESKPVVAPTGAGPLRQGKPIEPDVQKMAADAQFLSLAAPDIQALKKYVGTDRPGGGPVAGRLPDFMTGDEGNAQRQAAQRLMNAIIYMSTGKQINEQEAKRLLLARGIGPQSAQSAFDVGIPALEKELRQAARTYKAKYRPEVHAALRERGGLEWLDSLLEEDAAPGVKTYNPKTGRLE